MGPLLTRGGHYYPEAIGNALVAYLTRKEPMEIKDFHFKLKALADAGTFTGLAAEFGVVDLQGDVLERGSFKRAIDQQGDGFPLLWSHRQDMPIGLAKLTDSERGPIVHGSIDLGDPDGARAFRRAKQGIVRGLSIGFDLPNSAAVRYTSEGTRHISELRLHEISLVSVPAQRGAQILEVRSLGDAARVIGGFDAERMGGPELAALRSIETHVKRLLDGHHEPAPDAAILADLRDMADAVWVGLRPG